jgi:hypothetical protein
MKPVLAGQGVTLRAPFTQTVKHILRIPVVPASRFLTDITDDRPHVPYLRRSDSMGSLGEQGVFCPKDVVFLDVAEPAEGAYFQDPTLFPDGVHSRNALDIHDGFGRFRSRSRLEKIEEIRSSGMDHRVTGAQGGKGIIGRSRMDI